MKGNKSLSIFLIALMAFGALLMGVPFASAPGWPPITVDGKIGDWDAIQNLTIPGAIAEQIGDTENWSHNITIVSKGATGETLSQMSVNDKARDLKALYMWLEDSGTVNIRLDVAALYPGWNYPLGNASVYHIYFDIDDNSATGASAGLNACEITAIGWERMLYFDGVNAFVMDNTGTVLADTGGIGGLTVAVNVTTGSMEFGLDRAQCGMSGITLVSVSAFSFKPGNVPYVFDPDDPGGNGVGVGGPDFADELPDGVTLYGEVQAGKDLRTDMAPNAQIHLFDKATGKEDLTGDWSTDDTFTLALEFKSAQDLYSWGIGMHWDPTVLNCTGWTYNTTWFTGTLQVAGTINNTGGYMTTFGNSLSGATGISGSGWLAQISFIVLSTADYKGTWITLDVAGILDSAGVPYATPIKNAYFAITPPEPVLPVASFTESGGPYYNGTTVITFTDTSTAGSINGTTQPIVSWYWQFGDGDTNTLQNPTHMYALPGDYMVNLTITDNASRTDVSANEIKTVIVKPTGDVIDVYTEVERAYGYTAGATGAGPNMPADAYQIDENVTLYANVSHNGYPLQSRLVVFEVWNGADENVLLRTVLTDANGVATTTFRIATVCLDREHAWGKWTVLAKTSVAKEPINDTMMFDVGDYVDFVGTGVTTASSWKIYEHMSFTITLKNIAMTARNVTIVVTVYDDLEVPIGKINVTKSIAGGAFCSPHEEVYDMSCLMIPKWAYVGPNAKVYVSALTAWPSVCGVAYCEEATTGFQIKAP